MKALIIVDMQTDFISGSLGTPEAQAIVPNVVNKLKQHENTNTLILFTKDTHYDNYLETSEGKKLPVPHCIKGTEGWCIQKDIAAEFKVGHYISYSSESIINSRVLKETFGSYDLINLLYNIDAQIEEGISEIEFCGLVTNICLVSNVLMTKAAFPNVPVIVDASCCAGVTPEKHAAALEVMRSCQIEVIE